MSEPPASPEPPSRTRWIVAGACCSCVALALCVGSAFIAASAIRPAPARGVLAARGGRVELGGIAIDAPPGALAADRDVTLAVGEPAPSPDKNVAFASRAFAIDAGDGAFEKSITLELPYDPSLVPAGAEQRLAAHRWTGSGWEPVESRVDAARRRVVATTAHLSTWVAAFPRSPLELAKRHPTLPFDIYTVEKYPPKQPEMVDAVSRSIEAAWLELTTRDPRRPWMLGEPPLDPSKRLAIVITDLGSPEARREFGTERFGGANGLAVSDELLLIHHGMQDESAIWSQPAHEFVHVIQHRYEKRALEIARATKKPAISRWKPWIAEATAVYFQAVIAHEHDGQVNDQPGFCFEELLYHSQVGEPRKGSEFHQYQAQVFIDYLVFRFGAKIVRAIFDGWPYAKDDRESLEKAISETTDRRETLAKVYKDFVLAHEFTHAFGEKPFQVRRKPGEIAPPPDKIETVEVDDAVPGSTTIAARTFEVPRIVRVIPGPKSWPCRLELELASKEKPELRWMWAFGPTGSTFRLLGGDAKRLSITLDAPTSEVLVFPVSMTTQALELGAKLGGAAPGALELRSDGTSGTYHRLLFASFTIDFHRSFAEMKKLEEKLGHPKWIRVELTVGGTRCFEYVPWPQGQSAVSFSDQIPNSWGTEPIEVVATCQIDGEVVTGRRTFVAETAYLERQRRALAQAQARLVEREKMAKASGSDPAKPGACGEQHLEVAQAAEALGDFALAESEYTKVGDRHRTTVGLAALALDRGDVDRYESLRRSISADVDKPRMAAAAVRWHDDLDRARRLQGARVPLAGDKIVDR